MAYLIALDDGHGMETAGKRTPAFPDGSVMKENEFNRAVVEYLDEELKRCGFDTLLTAGGISDNADVPLKLRTDLANNTIKNRYNRPADYFISVHANAYTGTWTDETSTAQGISTHIQEGLPKTGNTYKYAEIVHKWLLKGSKLRDRGIVFQNLHVTRETKMSAVLVECGFMDNTHDAEFLRSDEYRRETALELAQAVCEIFGVAYVAEGGTYPETPKTGRKIIDKPSVNVEQMQKWATAKGAANWFVDEAPTYYAVSVAVGVNPAVTYAQSAKETGFGKFGGVLDETYCNPCGMKGESGGGDYDPSAHQRFVCWRDGISAQVDHLALYAGIKGYPTFHTFDPRNFAYLHGTAKTVEELGGKWAPSASYGDSIVKMMAEMEVVEAAPPAEEAPAVSDWAAEALEWVKANGISDGSRPKEPVTGERLFTMLHRFYNLLQK